MHAQLVLLPLKHSQSAASNEIQISIVIVCVPPSGGFSGGSINSMHKTPLRLSAAEPSSPLFQFMSGGSFTLQFVFFPVLACFPPLISSFQLPFFLSSCITSWPSRKGLSPPFLLAATASMFLIILDKCVDSP